jgi:flagellar basal-body rod protein FlgG
MWTAANGMKANMIKMDVIANNLANAGVNGFKKSNPEFQDLLYQTLVAPGQSTGADTRNPVGQQVGVGTRLSAISKQFTQGDMIGTGNDLNVAIMGQGLFELEGAQGEKIYTRDGNFHLSDQGEIVNADGYKLANIQAVPTNYRKINFNKEGYVSYIDADSGQETDLGRLQLVTFANYSGLDAQGGNIYKESQASGAATPVNPGEQGAGTISHQFLEGSNVVIVEEMVKLMSAERSYQTNSKAIRAGDEMLEIANQIAR